MRRPVLTPKRQGLALGMDHRGRACACYAEAITCVRRPMIVFPYECSRQLLREEHVRIRVIPESDYPAVP